MEGLSQFHVAKVNSEKRTAADDAGKPKKKRGTKDKDEKGLQELAAVDAVMIAGSQDLDDAHRNLFNVTAFSVAGGMKNAGAYGFVPDRTTDECLVFFEKMTAAITDAVGSVAADNCVRSLGLIQSDADVGMRSAKRLFAARRGKSAIHGQFVHDVRTGKRFEAMPHECDPAHHLRSLMGFAARSMVA